MAICVGTIVLALVSSAQPAAAQRWATAWMAAGQGPYPLGGNQSAAVDLSQALPAQAASPGARDQTFRMVIKPDIWGSRIRLRFSNALGTRPLALDGVFVGLHNGGAGIMPQSNRPVLFGGKKAVAVAPGQAAWSDAVTLPYVGNAVAPELVGRKLAVSFHVAGESGPLTWHALGLQASYVTPPGAGALSELEDEAAFPYSTLGVFVLDALDVQAGPETKLVVCLGDGMTDGIGSTPNGDDRWPDALARRLRGAGIRASVVNAGLSGSFLIGPSDAAAAAATDGTAGGGSATSAAATARATPSALARLDRDVLGLSNVTHVIWQPSLADLGAAGRRDWEAVRDAMRLGTERLRARLPGVRVIAATLPGIAAAGMAGGGGTQPYLDPEVDRKRRALNEWLRRSSGDLFDGVADFDAAVRDPRTGGLREEFVPSSAGGPGDGVHPNRAGYLALADAVDLRIIAAAPRPAQRRGATAEATPSQQQQQGR